MFSSEKVMLDYLNQLLTEEEVVESQLRPIVSNTKANRDNNVNSPKPTQLRPKPLRKASDIKPLAYKEPEIEPVEAKNKSLEKLLQQVSIKQQEEKLAKEKLKSADLEVTNVAQQAPQTVTKSRYTETQDVPEEPFQALFFEVAGLTLAVPLQELGGIFNLTEVNSLIGKPEWFHGVMLHREKKLNIVNSAQWVMPEKYDKSMKESLNYQYVITLGQSNWGLTAEKLVETESIHPDAVKWRSKPGKRPWLFGTIKEKMCALLHVNDLIAMLEQGFDARQEL